MLQASAERFIRALHNERVGALVADLNISCPARVYIPGTREGGRGRCRGSCEKGGVEEAVCVGGYSGSCVYVGRGRVNAASVRWSVQALGKKDGGSSVCVAEGKSGCRVCEWDGEGAWEKGGWEYCV